MHRIRLLRAAAALVALTLLTAACGDTKDASSATEAAPKSQSVAFASPADGAAVSNPVAVSFKTTGFTLEPAGDVHEGAGHLHVMVDLPCLLVGQVIPKDAQHVHFGTGQSEGAIDLAAGKHTLCLQAGDGAHTALDLTKEISVTVDDSPSVAFLEPARAAVVSSPITVKLAAFNFVLEPAGEVHQGAGHLHVMVDVACLAAGQVIPKDEQHVHLGQGQTEAELPLAPGEHTLCLQAADGAHTALNVTREVTVTVQG